jgi:hypothetical protein
MSNARPSTARRGDLAASIVWVFGVCLGAVPIATAAALPPPEGIQLDAVTVAVKAIYVDWTRRARTPSECAALPRDMVANRKETGTSANLCAVVTTAEKRFLLR